MKELLPSLCLIWLCGCHPDLPTSTHVALAFEAHDPSQDRVTQSGIVETVVAKATTTSGDPVQGVIVSLATNVAGVSFSPPSAASADDGTITSSVLVPFGTTVVGTAATGDGTFDNIVLTAAPLMITATPSPSMPSPGVAGAFVSVMATAQAGTIAAAGVPISFTTNTSGLVFSPATIPSGSMGSATSEIFVPYSSNAVLGFVTGGGGSAVVSLTPQLSDVNITVDPSTLVSTPAYGGTIVSVTGTAESGGVMLDELPLTFSSSAAGVTLTPATVLTNANGLATASIFVPFGTVPVVAVSGGGTVADISLKSVLSTPTLTLQATDLTNSTAVGGTAISISVTATGFAGLPLAFTSNVSGVTFNPASAITDGSGWATTVAFVPFGSTPVVTVSGGGTFASGSLRDALPIANISIGMPHLVGSTQAGSTGGVTYSVTATVTDATGAPLVGASVTFSAVGTNNAFSPQTVVTDQNGSATSYVFVANLSNSNAGSITAVAAAVNITSAPFAVP